MCFPSDPPPPQCLERVREAAGGPTHPLALLASHVQVVLGKELGTYSAAMRRFRPGAGGLATWQLHSLYGRELVRHTGGGGGTRIKSSQAYKLTS